jgi:hypothetical protein
VLNHKDKALHLSDGQTSVWCPKTVALVVDDRSSADKNKLASLLDVKTKMG